MNQNTSSPIQPTSGQNTNYSGPSSSSRTKPVGDLKAKKDFKKILGKTSRQDQTDESVIEEIEEEEAIISDEDAVDQQRSTPSLFDLTSGKASKAPASFTAALSGQEIAKKAVAGRDSPSDLFSKLSKAEANKLLGDETETQQAALLAQEKEKFPTSFGTEQPDLSYVNPMMAMMSSEQIQNLNVTAEKATQLSSANLEEIINQLVQKVEEMKNEDITETIVTLKNPPEFAESNIVVTSYDSARGQFNIAFENLKPDAKNLLDIQANKDALLLALEKKGYTVNILTVTTLVEHKPIIASAEDPRRQQDERQQQGGRHRNR